MKTVRILVFSLLVTGTALPVSAATQWDLNLAGGSGGLSSFSLSVGDYYNVPQSSVVAIQRRGIAEEELPVVFYLSQKAHVAPETIVSLRLRGLSWMDITLRYHLSPSIYYVPVDFGPQGPPRGRAYGYYRDYPRGGWQHVRLSDADVVNQVNLIFISEHHHCAPVQVARARASRRHFRDIEDEYEKNRGYHHRGRGHAGEDD